MKRHNPLAQPRVLTLASKVKCLLWLLMGILIAGCASSPEKPRKTEAELIKMLHASDSRTIIDAVDRLPHWYPNSTNALPRIKALLRDPAVCRKAARALGNYHAELEEPETDLILALLRNYDPDTVMDGLKTLRDLRFAPALRQKVTSHVSALLTDKNHHVVRDACRTLAIHGDASVIPAIEPLLKNSNGAIRQDARNAIDQLQPKP